MDDDRYTGCIQVSKSWYVGPQYAQEDDDRFAIYDLYHEVGAAMYLSVGECWH